MVRFYLMEINQIISHKIVFKWGSALQTKEDMAIQCHQSLRAWGPHSLWSMLPKGITWFRISGHEVGLWERQNYSLILTRGGHINWCFALGYFTRIWTIIPQPCWMHGIPIPRSSIPRQMPYQCTANAPSTNYSWANCKNPIDDNHQIYNSNQQARMQR